MLQFWLPRTAQFEEAVLGSLRWPFLFQDFDPAAERATIRILETLSRFENVGELPKEVVTSILVNQALRQKLAVEGDVKKQVELVKEALVEENEKVRSALASTAEQAERLKREVKEKDDQIVRLSGLLDEHETKTTRTEAELGQERKARQDVATRLDRLEQRMGEESKRQEIRGFLFVWLTVIVVALGAASVCLYVSRPGLGFWKTSSVVWSSIFLIWMLFADRLGQTKSAVKEWGPYLKFQEVKKWLFGLVAFVAVWTFCEFVGRAAYEWVRTALRR